MLRAQDVGGARMGPVLWRKHRVAHMPQWGRKVTPQSREETVGLGVPREGPQRERKGLRVPSGACAEGRTHPVFPEGQAV